MFRSRVRRWELLAAAVLIAGALPGAAGAVTPDPAGSHFAPGGPNGKARVTVSWPVPGVRVAGSEIVNLVDSGGCVAVDGIVPPCIPPEVLPVFSGKSFRTRKTALLNLKAQVAVESSWARDDAVSGSARVKVQLEVDGNLVGEGETFTLSGGQDLVLREDRRFLLPPGRHQVGLKLEGSGYDYVNLSGKSARVRAFISRTVRR